MSPPDRAPESLGAALRSWFTTPPRPHGEVVRDRTVSFLELLFDLVFVVLVGQVAHHLAVHVSWSGVIDFAIVFTMIWIAWVNGSMYHESHGREDGRSRTLIFLQMYLLVLLAVFAGEAPAEDSAPFAITYAVLLAVLAAQWWSVRRYDVELAFRRATANFVVGLCLAILVMLASLLVEGSARLLLWAVVVIGWLLSVSWQFASRQDRPLGVVPTESMAERFGLFTIIVLGEVVVGVVGGMTQTSREPLAMTTGLLALTICFGFWWNYFDAVGRRVPRESPRMFVAWVVAHLPLTGAIAAAGAGMVSLIEHWSDERTPVGTAWLLAGSSALMLALLALLVATVHHRPGKSALTTRVEVALLTGALACLVIGVIRPQAWLLALLIALVHGGVWAYGFVLRVTPRVGV